MGLIDDLWEVVIQTANEVAQEMEDDVKRRISEPYPPASDPGEPPHRRSGRLAEDAGSVVVVDEGSKTVTVNCGTDVFYGEYLEEGTDRMEPRPVWRQLQEDWEPKLRDRLRENIAKRFGA